MLKTKSIFVAMSKWRPGGLLVVPDAIFWAYRRNRGPCRKSRLAAVYGAQSTQTLAAL